tara:strand:+ start:27612 stop:30932 length:3321 start_codon:yes stop_codon:yes gene_type:complete
MQANSSYSQKTKISLDKEDVMVRDIIDEIETTTEFKFLFNTKAVDLNRKVSIKVKRVPIQRVLELLFKEVDTSYELDDRKILLKRKTEKNGALVVPASLNSTIVQKTISGNVSDMNGQPLPGANIVEKGTNNGVTADFDGNFSIEISNDNGILIVSYIGFATKEVPLNGQNTINIALEESAAGLDEVVVVGYGTQKKVNLTGAISTVDFDDELNNRPITNASQALGGTASGIWVSQNSGKPGSDESQIRVRGWGTLNNSNPLILVDGVEGSFSQINPNDIENISVLKDAASAAIYGSKAANGVVLITTKMGSQNEKMQVNINSYFGLQSLGRRYDLITNSAEHMQLSNQALANDGSSALFSDSLISDFENGNDQFRYPNTDWFDVLFKTATIQEHNVSIRGGSDKTSSFVSFNYLDQEGMVPNTNSTRYGIRANVDSNVNDWLQVSARFNYIRKDSNEPYADITYGSLGRVFEMLVGATPYIAPYTRDGRFGSVEAIDADGNLLYDNRNPLIDAANGQTKTEENIVTINASVNIQFNDQLSLRTTLAANNNWNLVDKYNTSVFGYTDSGIETITKNYNREGLEINRSQITSVSNNLFSTLNYNNTFGEKHDVSGIAGIQLESNKIQNVYARRSSPPKEGLTQVDAGTSGIQGEGNLNKLRIFSYFGRINYAFDSKYLLEANLRADASSRFMEGNRWGVFPGFSAGWRISEESFLKDSDFLSNLKLRASWGQLGNQNISGYWPYLTVVGQNNDLSYNYGGSFAAGAAVTALVDENVTWETTSTLDFGIDLSLLNNKISIEADYFQKKTEDILVQLPIPLILGGITAPFENVGEMSNNGFEFIINYNNQKFDRSEFSYNLGLNVTYIENEVTKFRGGDSPDQLYLIREGFSYRTLYGYKVEGIYQSDQEALEHMHSNSFVPKAGNLKFEDLNNDGRIGFEDNQALGNTIPKWTYGFSAGMKYQGFDLSLLFQGVGGLNGYNQNSFTNVNFENRALSTKWRNAWTPSNTDTNMPSLRFNNSWDGSPSSFWVQKLNFVKLKNIQMGFTFPEAISSAAGLSKIYLYANAQNVFTLVNDDYQGYDPERSSFDSGGALYPTPRIVSLGVNLNF